MKGILGWVVIVGLIIFMFISDRSSYKDEHYTAVIVEPRKHKATRFVLENILTHLDSRWNVLFFHGTENGVWARELVEQSLPQYKHRIKYKSLGVANLTISEYNRLLVSREFTEQIPTETFLIFQTDSMICPKYRDRINEFIGRYDYVGAPWLNNGTAEIGNGGFSLRKRSAMLDIISWYHYNGENEDVYFANGCRDGLHVLPSVEDAQRFSIETMNMRNAFGVHKPWLLWDMKERSKEDPDGWLELCRECEGLETLAGLQGVEVD